MLLILKYTYAPRFISIIIHFFKYSIQKIDFFGKIKQYFITIFSIRQTTLFRHFQNRNISKASVGTEELAHLEIVATIVHQLTRNLTPDEIMASGFGPYYIDHTLGVWPQAASGVPFSSTQFQVAGDPITDLSEDMAAEQKARTTYENILRVVKDPEVCDPIRFLREREVVHYQRFGEGLRIIQDTLNSKNFYAFNPDFNSCKSK